MANMPIAEEFAPHSVASASPGLEGLDQSLLQYLSEGWNPSPLQYCLDLDPSLSQYQDDVSSSELDLSGCHRDLSTGSGLDDQRVGPVDCSNFPSDQSLGQNLPEEGDESPVAPTPTSQADFRWAGKVGSSDDSRLVRGEGSGPQSMLGHDAIDQNLEDGGVQEEARETMVRIKEQSRIGDIPIMCHNRGSSVGVSQSGREMVPSSNHAIILFNSEVQGPICVANNRKSKGRINRQSKEKKGRKNWALDEKTCYFRLRKKAERLGIRRGQRLWEFISGKLWAQFKIRRTAKECSNLWDTSKRNYDAIQKYGPHDFWKMPVDKRSSCQLRQEFKLEWYNTIKSIYQKNLSNETRGIAGHEPLGDGDGDNSDEEREGDGDDSDEEREGDGDDSDEEREGDGDGSDEEGDRDRDKDLLGTEESEHANEVKDIISSEVNAVMATLEPLCSTEDQKKQLETTTQHIMGDVKALEPHFLHHFNQAHFGYLVRELIREEVKSAFQRTRIESTLLHAARLKRELQVCRGQNREVVEEQRRFRGKKKA